MAGQLADRDRRDSFEANVRSESVSNRHANGIPVAGFTGLSPSDLGAPDIVRRCLDDRASRGFTDQKSSSVRSPCPWITLQI